MSAIENLSSQLIENTLEFIEKTLDFEDVAEGAKDEDEEDSEDDENTLPGSRETRPPRKLKNIITRLQTGSFQGPLRLLWQCSRDGRRVRVWIRSLKNVHAICCGQVAAFDAHFNLALINVDEVSMVRNDALETGRAARKKRNRSRRRIKAAIARAKASTEIETQVHENLHEGATSQSEKLFCLPFSNDEQNSEQSQQYRIVKRRHMSQLFIRGDEVLIISPVPHDNSN